MNRSTKLSGFVGLVLIASAFSQTDGPPSFNLSWSTIDSGGGTSIGGTFALSGTIGQSDASGPLTGGTFSLSGGFWPGAGPAPNNCPANIIASGTSATRVDVDDLLAVITSWGACAPPCPPHCAADIAPAPSGNCAVNVDDLLAVIVGWGPCP